MTSSPQLQAESESAKAEDPPGSPYWYCTVLVCHRRFRYIISSLGGVKAAVCTNHVADLSSGLGSESVLASSVLWASLGREVLSVVKKSLDKR